MGPSQPHTPSLTITPTPPPIPKNPMYLRRRHTVHILTPSIQDKNNKNNNNNISSSTSSNNNNNNNNNNNSNILPHGLDRSSVNSTQSGSRKPCLSKDATSSSKRSEQHQMSPKRTEPGFRGRDLRRHSLPNCLEVITPALTFNGSGSVMDTPGSWTRRGSSESITRELQCVSKNGVAERRLQAEMVDLERRSWADRLDWAQQRRQLITSHRRVLQTSPSAEQWLTMRRARTAALQARARDDIKKRYSRQWRHFRPPPHLKAAVARVRNLALLQAQLGTLGPQATGSTHSTTPLTTTAEQQDEDGEILSQMTSLSLERRHSSADVIASEVRSRSDEHGLDPKPSARRRLTLSDLHGLRHVLETQPNLAAIQGQDEDEEIEEDMVGCLVEEDLEPQSAIA